MPGREEGSASARWPRHRAASSCASGEWSPANSRTRGGTKESTEKVRDSDSSVDIESRSTRPERPASWTLGSSPRSWVRRARSAEADAPPPAPTSAPSLRRSASCAAAEAAAAPAARSPACDSGGGAAPSDAPPAVVAAAVAAAAAATSSACARATASTASRISSSPSSPPPSSPSSSDAPSSPSVSDARPERGGGAPAGGAGAASPAVGGAPAGLATRRADASICAVCGWPRGERRTGEVGGGRARLLGRGDARAGESATLRFASARVSGITTPRPSSAGLRLKRSNSAESTAGQA